ncbi:hypothetical protein Tco_0420956, partial [Tanacetum coccineum]
MNALTLPSLIEKEKLNGTNFLDCHRNLRIIVKYEEKLDTIETHLPKSPTTESPPDQVSAYQYKFDEKKKITLLMYINSDEGIHVDEDKVKAVRYWLSLKILTEVRTPLDKFSEDSDNQEDSEEENNVGEEHSLMVIGIEVEVIGKEVVKENKDFVHGAWSDSEDGDQKEKNKTCLMALGSQRENIDPSKFNNNLNIDELQDNNDELIIVKLSKLYQKEN